jgi:predicted MFS family arabinose efflux permease
MNGVSLVVVLQLQLGQHRNVPTAALTLLPWSCGLAISSWISGTRLVPRYGSRLMLTGLVTVLAAIAAYATTPASGYPWLLLPALAFAGLGLGQFTVSFFTAALARVQPHETGSAAGLLNAVQQFGGTVGIAALGSVFLGRLSTASRADSSLSAAQAGLWIAAAVLAATVIAAWLMTRRPTDDAA